MTCGTVDDDTDDTAAISPIVVVDDTTAFSTSMLIPVDDAIATLEQQIRLIKSAGEIAPNGCWLESGKCHKRKSRQVFYRSSQPIFGGKKSKYVGMEGSGKVAAARDAIARRNELKRLRKQLEILRAAT
ncbi:MAG: hypothetical protein HC781_22700 [Leptolyngbyaceae cyanobacterium CSU_1_4]|nr:hypothetical protein [Leptolyngbyaceae cyanobacterium CSU_1_4]